MPEGASPDYNCFAWGQNINGVPIWFNVNYNGVTGYYASFYDDSSYHSNEELTAKYGVPLCGSAPPAATPAPPAAAPPTPGASPPKPAAVYFNPYARNDPAGPHLVGDGATLDLDRGSWDSACGTSRSNPRRPYGAAMLVAGDRPVVTVSGWSAGKVGMLSFFANATVDQLKQVSYGLLIDPGTFGDMECDRERGVAIPT